MYGDSAQVVIPGATRGTLEFKRVQEIGAAAERVPIWVNPEIMAKTATCERLQSCRLDSPALREASR